MTGFEEDEGIGMGERMERGIGRNEEYSFDVDVGAKFDFLGTFLLDAEVEDGPAFGILKGGSTRALEYLD